MQNDVRGSVDLTECAREPIHVPGFIQSFGVLLAMPAGSDKISQISSNTQLMFAADPLEVVGKKLADVLGQANADQIFAILKAGDWKEANPLKISAKNAAPPLS